MKLNLTRHGRARCFAAAFRNCLSYEYAPLACPVRKCRRDGFCAGPLVAVDRDARQRFTRADAADVAPGEVVAPVCYLNVAEDVGERVVKAYGAHCRALHAEPGAEVIETTRTIANRGWRRLAPRG